MCETTRKSYLFCTSFLVRELDLMVTHELTHGLKYIYYQIELLQNGYGLLHSAACKSRVEVAEYLIANGINIELRNDVRLCEIARDSE